MFPTDTCCSTTGLSHIANGTDVLSVHFASLLNNTNAACLASLAQLACVVCSPDQNRLFIVYEYEKHVTLCEGFANAVRESCMTAVLLENGLSMVRQVYHTGAGFVQYLLEPLYQVAVNNRSTHCYNPMLRPCTYADYTGFYTECVNDQRSAFFILSSVGQCNGGYVPEPVHNVRCSIACEDGNYLPIGAQQCKPCAAGSFSIGGGYRMHTFKQWPPGIVARSYCLNRRTGVPLAPSLCHPWVMDEWRVHSGAIGNDEVSVLEITVELVRHKHRNI
jgi:hypothetical protein